MKIGMIGCIGGLLAMASSFAGAQTPAPAPATSVIKTTFEEDAGGWQTFGDGGKVAVTHEASKVKVGKGALQFDYSVEKGKVQALVFPTPDGKLAKMKSLRFWARADHTTPLMVALAEKDGGRYNAMFTAPGGQWQQVELTPDDFVLSVDKNDPKDPDGKLDLDKVENIGILDVNVFLAQNDDANFAALLNVHKGAHALLINDFTVSSEPLPGAAPAADKKILPLEGLAHPQLDWLRLGAVEISAAKGKPLDTPSVKASYHAEAGKFAGLLRSTPIGKLAGKTDIEFAVASAKPIKLLIQIEETSGGKYNVIVDVPGNSEVTQISQAFADFTASSDSTDDNGKLDLGQVKMILLADVTGGDADNTLWIGKLRATTK